MGRQSRALSYENQAHCLVDGIHGFPSMVLVVGGMRFCQNRNVGICLGVVGCDHIHELGLRSAHRKMVWIANDLDARFRPGIDSACACAVGPLNPSGALASLWNCFQTNLERPNLQHVKAFWSHRLAVMGATWILVWLFIAIAGSAIRPDATPMANDQHLEMSLLAPGTAWQDDAGEVHKAWLGTDRFGRDLLSRLMAGSTISLTVGAGAVLISLFLGLLLGGVAGYVGGMVDRILSWFLQVMWSIPTLLMVLAITLAFGKGFWQVFLAIGLTMWVEVARIVRGQFLTLREQAYVQAAEALDLPAWRVMLRHMLPNAVGPLVVVCAANFAAAILMEAGLSFLGVGAQIPMPSWGNIVKEHAHLLTTEHAWLALIPGGLIASLVLAFTWVGDGLRTGLQLSD